MRFGILGALQLVRDGHEVDLGRRQERLLLARLLIDANRTVAVDRLIDELWGESPPPSATGTLHGYLSRLRRVLEPDRAPSAPPAVLVTRPPGYALIVDAEDLDAARFEMLAERGRAHRAAGRHAEARADLDEALGLWRGDVLADLADEAFVAPVAARMELLRADVREERAHSLLATGAIAEAIADLEELTATEAIRERPWELLLTALHASGRTVEALERYRQLRERLADELGLDPGPGLQAIEEAMLRGDRLGPARAAPVAEPPAAPPLPPAVIVPQTTTASELVGRGREQEELAGALSAALEGRTSWVVVVGEAGIGKSRLVTHLADVARDRGALPVFGRCHEADLTPAFWPWVQALRGLDGLVADASAILEQEAEHTGDPAAQLFSLFDRVAGVLSLASRRTPLLVVLEDLHWADPESLQLVEFLAVQLQDAPVALALTSRRGEGTAALRRTLGELARQPGHVRLELTGLDTCATTALLAAVTGRDVDAGVAAALQERTGGNPFFVTELARLGGPALEGATLPDTIREVLARRLGRLPGEAAGLLTLAAVHGAEFSLDALVATSTEDELAVLDRLDLALESNLIVSTEDPARFRFAHALVREAALEGLTDLRRRRLHVRIATSLRGLAPEDATAWRAEVAHHLLAAAPLGDAAEALAAARAAAEVADSRLAFHEAARWWAGALRVLEWDRTLGADQRLRHDLLVALGCSLGDAGERPAAIQRLAEAIDVAESLGDATAMAQAAINFERTGGFWFWSEYGVPPVELMARLDRVLAALGDDEPSLRIRVLLVAATGEYYGDQARGRALAAEALVIARQLDVPELVASALIASVRIHWTHDDLPTLHSWTREVLDLAIAHGLPEMELLGWTYRLAWSLIEGDMAEAEHCYRRASGLSQRLGLVIYQAQLAWSAPTFPLVHGDLDAARRLVGEAQELHTRTRLYSLDVITAWNRMVLAWEADALDDITDEERAAFAGVFPEGEVALLLRDGERDAARALLEQVCRERPLQPLFDAIGLAVVRARLAVDLEAVELATGLRAALEPYPTYLGALGTCCTTGPVATELGRLQSLLGDHDAAMATLEQGLTRAEDARWPRWAERTRAAIAEVLTRQHGGTVAPRAEAGTGA